MGSDSDYMHEMGYTECHGGILKRHFYDDDERKSNKKLCIHYNNKGMKGWTPSAELIEIADELNIKLDTVGNFNGETSDSKHRIVTREGSLSAPWVLYDEVSLRILENPAYYGNLSKSFELVEDIHLTGTFTPIGNFDNPFTGNFNGNNHKISNIDIQQQNNNCIGFFSVIDGGANITDLHLSGKAQGGDSIGLLAGFLLDGSRADNVFAVSEIVGDSEVGGLIGFNRGSIENCNVFGKITGKSYVGGLVGAIEYRGIIVNCCAICDVVGHDAVGGLIGANDVGEDEKINIHNSYVITTVTGSCSTGILVGRGYEYTINCYAKGTINISFESKKYAPRELSQGPDMGDETPFD